MNPSARPPVTDIPDALTATACYSRHLQRQLAASPELAEELCKDAPLTQTDLDTWLLAAASPAPLSESVLKPALRRMKRRAFARIAARDLGHGAPLAEVVEAMTLTAETAIRAALTVLAADLSARYGLPRNEAGAAQQLIVIGMGKLGGRELNVSSDIDLIFVYPEDGETDGTRKISNFDYFTRLGRNLINAIADITEDGQVFRVDMRLRPNGDSGPLVCTFAMLENYFLSQGREWERYAWIKARPLTGERLDELEAIRRPFIFRKYLDFSAIDAMRDLHTQIRREVAKKDMANNVKLGPGGIREIEFIAQVFQLIRGGRDVGLQIKPTLQVLERLAERGLIETHAAHELASAYDFLRRVEHRLQFRDDAQTHRLPTEPKELALLAQAMKFSNTEGFLEELDDHRQNVARHFAAVFGAPQEVLGEHPLDALWRDAQEAEQAAAAPASDAALDELTRLGYREPPTLRQRLAALRGGSRYGQLNEAARSRVDSLIPRLIALAARLPDADAGLIRCLELIEAVMRRPAYLSLLLQYPQALERLVKINGASGWAANFLLRHPLLLDELLESRDNALEPDWNAWRLELDHQLEAAAPDMERQMDLMREAHHAQVFRFLALDVASQLELTRLSDHLSALADLILELTLKYAWRQVTRRHCATPRFAILSYGKLGGKELGYASDLDLVYVFDDDHAEAAQNYSRLATRINTWLSSQTAAGLLFETDLRLRPNGDAGLVVTSFAALRQYQLESAWLWEHQALTRARFSAGAAAIGAAFEALRLEVLTRPRNLTELKREVLAMRQKMRAVHAGKSEQFDLKHDEGGLIDVEFIVQTLVLGHAAQHPQLTQNRGNLALLGIAAEAGLIPLNQAQAAQAAYREYRRRQHALRLNSIGAASNRIVPLDVTKHIAAVKALWATVFAPGE